MNTKSLTLMLLCLVFAIGSGCTPEPKIESYTIPKSRSGLEKLREKLAAKDSTQPREKTTRMAVAIFEHADATWFVKIVGPTKQVNATESQWKSFFKNVRFKDGNPTWDLPEGWSVAGPKPMRFETLVIGDYQPPLEVAISSLGPNQDLLLNVNRWRVQQLGLSPATSDDLDEMVQKQQSESGQFLVFDVLGFGSGRMTPPFAGGAAPFAGGSPPFAGAASDSADKQPTVETADPNSDSTTGATDLTFDVPEGWTAGKASSIVHARLKKAVDEATAQITIIELTPTNEWQPNVERWAGEVGLSGLTEKQLADRTSELVVDGVKGKLIDLVDLDSQSPTATIAGMFKHDDAAWFLKLTGDKQIVNDSRDAFEKFITSIHFK